MSDAMDTDTRTWHDEAKADTAPDNSPLEVVLLALQERCERMQVLVDRVNHATRSAQRQEPADEVRAVDSEALARDDSSTVVKLLASRCHNLDITMEALADVVRRLEL